MERVFTLSPSSLETYAPPTKSHPGSLLSKDRIPHFNPYIPIPFPSAKSESISPVSETIPCFSCSIPLLFPPTNSETESSENDERTPTWSSSLGVFLPKIKSQLNNLFITKRVQQFDPSIESIFPPTKSETNSSENDKRTPSLSSSELGVFPHKTKSQPNTVVIISKSVPHFHLSIESVFPATRSDTDSLLSDDSNPKYSMFRTNNLLSKSVPHFHPSIDSVFPATKSDTDSLFSDDSNPDYSETPSTRSYSPSNKLSSVYDLSYKNATTKISRPPHPAVYQDKAKISRLLFPKKVNHQPSPTTESIQLQFPEDGSGKSNAKENISNFQSFPDNH